MKRPWRMWDLWRMWAIRWVGGLLAFIVAMSSTLIAATGAVGSQGIKFVPLARGPLGDVNAKDGDSGFFVEYFAAGEGRGAPLASRLERSVGSDKTPIPGLNVKGYRARWTATLTPQRTGQYALALRSTGTAVLKLDGKKLIERSAGIKAGNFTQRYVSTAEMERGKPYEIVIEFENPNGKGRIAAEWGVAAATAKKKNGNASPGRKDKAGKTDEVEMTAGPQPGTTIGAPGTLKNEAYTLESRADGSLALAERASGGVAIFQPLFSVVYQAPGQETKLDAKGAKYQDDGPVGCTNYLVPTWDKEPDFLAAAHPRTRLRASAATVEGGRILWRFPEEPAYALTAEITLPQGTGEPVVTAHLKAKAAGQYSLGYTGVPEVATNEAQWIWQPLVWQDRRFPNRSYLTKEFECPIPMVMVGANGNAIGVGADPREMPYRMPNIQDSRFGVLVRNAAGKMQPMLFAPVLGGPESKMSAGQDYSFSLRLFVRRGAWFDGFKSLARGLYGFGDIRENGLCSLNTTIDNMMEFLLTDKYSYWYPQFKTWGYQNDSGPGAGRQQSAADALGLALVCDNERFLKLRALPTLEYMLSRRSVSTKMTVPDFMGGFVNNSSDLTAAYQLTGRRSTVLRELLEKTVETAGRAPKAGSRNEITQAKSAMLENLSAYRLTEKCEFLNAACVAADRYIAARIEKPAENFADLGSSFWNELSPSYDVLYELYQETGEKRYLDAAAAAMRQFTAYVYMVPVIPAGDFTANPGGLYNGQSVPEEHVPAWRVSANGLTAECAGTAHSHRGVFMASYAAWMARLAGDTGETFFRDIARNAIVGRYANYPSYAYRNGYSTVYEKADYPLRPFEEIKKFTSAHYNHPLPMTAFLIDYLVSDVYGRSGGKIAFPSEYTNTGAYFRNKVYGARPGRFYDEQGVKLWLPKGLIKADSIQVNTLGGYGNGKLYLALSNQSKAAITIAIIVNQERVKLGGTHRCRVWIDNQEVAPLTMTNGGAKVNLAPKGLTCLAVEGAEVKTEVQAAMLDTQTPPLPAGSSRTVATKFGDVTATALRLGKGLTSVHLWLKAGPDQVKSVKLNGVAAGRTWQAECTRFPYEFTIPAADQAGTFRCTAEALMASGATERSEEIVLQMREETK